MMGISRSMRRLAAFGAVFAVIGVAACNQDDISGPVDQFGPPLLDIEVGPASSPVWPAASNTINAARDTMRITLSNLPPLPTGAAYQVWLVDTASAANNAVVASGQVVVTTTSTRPVNRDSSVTITTADTAASANTITATGANKTAVMTITNASIGGTIATYTHAIVTVTGTPATGAQTVGADDQVGFLSRRYRSGTTYSTGGFTFGTWSINSAKRQPYTITAAGINGAFWGDSIIVNVDRTLRPPAGFQYVGWLIDDRTGIQQRLGGLTTPPPESRSLQNADTETGTFLTTVAIVDAQLRAAAMDPDNYTRFVLVLEPKMGAAPRASSAEAFAGQIPKSVASRHSSAGRMGGKVTSTSGATVTGTTVFLTGRNLSTPLLVANADASGSFLFRTVQVGDYTVKAIPPGGTAVVDSVNVTVGFQPDPAGGFKGDSVFVQLRIP